MLDATDATKMPLAAVPGTEPPKPEGLLVLLVAVVVVAALYLAKTVLIPITLAILLSFVLGPVVMLLRRLRVPKVLSVLLAVLLALAVIVLIGGLIGTQLANLAGNLPHYQATVLHKFEAVRDFMTDRLRVIMSHFGHLPGADDHSVEAPAQAPHSEAEAGAPQPMPVAVQEPSPSALALAQRILTPILGPIETIGIVIVFAVFFLLQQEDLRDRLIRLFGSRDLHRTTLAIDDAAKRLSRYFLTQTGINAGFGVVIGIGLTIIGVPSPLLWGVLAMLLRFVPYIGSLIAVLMPAALAAAVDPHWGLAVWTVVLFVATEGITGQVIEPMLYGRSTGLSPVAVLVVAIFWGWLWGPIGLILSTPLTLCLVVVSRHVKRLEFFDVLLGDRPALTPIETFYQRLLAHDPDEVQEQAEQLLQTRSLSAYYDGVALKGLALAAHDILRGALSHTQIERLRRDLTTLVDELDGWDDIDPPERLSAKQVTVSGVARPERMITNAPAPLSDAAEPDVDGTEPGPRPIALCAPGRGPLDDIGAAMVGQLLGKHGFDIRIVPHEATSRGQIAALQTEGLSLLCVVSLEVVGHPPSLRYLLRRLRQRVPGVPLLVGLWPAEDAFLTNEDMHRMMGADGYASSLREMVIQAVENVARAAAPRADATSDETKEIIA